MQATYFRLNHERWDRGDGGPNGGRTYRHHPGRCVPCWPPGQSVWDVSQSRWKSVQIEDGHTAIIQGAESLASLQVDQSVSLVLSEDESGIQIVNTYTVCILSIVYIYIYIYWRDLIINVLFSLLVWLLSVRSSINSCYCNNSSCSNSNSCSMAGSINSSLFLYSDRQGLPPTSIRQSRKKLN